MKKLVLAGLAVVLAPGAAVSQDEGASPRTTDLGFLVGTWEVSVEGFNIHDPDAPPVSRTSTKVCEYALEFKGEPTFIVCETTSETSDGSEVKLVEYINYNPEAGAFEKANIYNVWPVKVIETLTFDKEKRVIEIRGRVNLEEGLESYVEYWNFNEDYSSFERAAWMNYPTFAMTDFRQTLKGLAVKAE